MASVEVQAGIDAADGWARLPHAADGGPAARLAIGVLTLASDIATEGELRAFLPSGGVGVFASRIPRAKASTLANLRDMEGHIVEATARLVPDDDLHAIAFSCTSGTAAIGAGRVAELVASVRPGVPVTDPLTAGMRALERFGARRIALLTPYRAEVNEVIAAAVEASGLTIVRRGGFFCGSGYDMSRISGRSVAEAALALAAAPEVEALFVSCTALSLSPVIDDIETRLGKPVVFSTQAMAWDAMRLAGFKAAVPGRGRLLAQ